MNDATTLPDDLISTVQAGKLLGGLHSSSVSRWIKERRLTGYRAGNGPWKVSRAEVLSKIRVWPGGDQSNLN